MRFFNLFFLLIFLFLSHLMCLPRLFSCQSHRFDAFCFGAQTNRAPPQTLYRVCVFDYQTAAQIPVAFPSQHTKNRKSLVTQHPRLQWLFRLFLGR